MAAKLKTKDKIKSIGSLSHFVVFILDGTRMRSPLMEILKTKTTKRNKEN